MFTVCDNGKNRKMTAEEIAEQEKFIAGIEETMKKQKLQELQKEALLTRLGLTADELATLLA